MLLGISNEKSPKMEWTRLLWGWGGGGCKEIRVDLPPMALTYASLSKCSGWSACNRVCTNKHNQLLHGPLAKGTWGGRGGGKEARRGRSWHDWEGDSREGHPSQYTVCMTLKLQRVS